MVDRKNKYMHTHTHTHVVSFSTGPFPSSPTGCDLCTKKKSVHTRCTHSNPTQTDVLPLVSRLARSVSNKDTHPPRHPAAASRNKCPPRKSTLPQTTDHTPLCWEITRTERWFARLDPIKIKPCLSLAAKTHARQSYPHPLP